MADGACPCVGQVEPYSGVLFWSCAEHNTINVTRLNGSQVGVVVGGNGNGNAGHIQDGGIADKRT